MASNRKTRSKRKSQTQMNKLLVVEEEVIPFSDAKNKDVLLFRKKDFEEELKKIYNKILAILPSVQKLGQYSLHEIELSVGVSGGILVVTVEGGITLRYSVPQSNQSSIPQSSGP
jgi:hypothetical protein